MKKSGREKTKPKNNGSSSRRVLLVLIIACIIVLGVLLGTNFSLFSSASGNKQMKSFNIENECSMIVGKMIHMINDEDACKMKCLSACKADLLGLASYNFSKKDSGCNICGCYCR